MRAAVIVAALLLCAPLQAQTVSDRELTRALSADPNDVPSLIQGLVDLRPTFQVAPAQLTRCLDAAGMRQDPFLDGLLSNAQSVRVDRGAVEIRFSEKTHLPMKDGDETLGWLHLAKKVTLEVHDDGKSLQRIRGLTVSRSRNGISGELLSLKIGPTTITVRAGKFAVPLFSKTFVVSQPSGSRGMSGRLP